METIFLIITNDTNAYSLLGMEINIHCMASQLVILD